MLVTAGSVLVERRGAGWRSGAGALIGEIEVLDPGAGRLATITAEGRHDVHRRPRARLLEGLAGSACRGRAARDPGGEVPGDGRSLETG